MNFDSNLAKFRDNCITINRATCNPYEIRLIDFLKRMNTDLQIPSLDLQNAILHLLKILSYSKE